MEKLKVGVIGTGSISLEHLNAYQKHPDVEIYALCDLDEALVKKRGEEFNVTRLFTKAEDMLRLPELQAVSVCAWNAAHAPLAIAALKAGKHVLCEKPMATSARDAQAMLNAAKESGKLLMIGFVRRFGNDCAILKDFIGQGSFGDIYYAKATYLRRKGNPGGWLATSPVPAAGRSSILGCM